MISRHNIVGFAIKRAGDNRIIFGVGRDYRDVCPHLDQLGYGPNAFQKRAAFLPSNPLMVLASDVFSHQYIRHFAKNKI